MVTQLFRRFVLLTLISIGGSSTAQTLIQKYAPLEDKQLQIGTGSDDVLPYIQSGYTLMLPETQNVEGVLIFMEDSGFDQKNKNSKQVYELAAKEGFAVLSVSTAIPFDFYFTDESAKQAHQLITEAFKAHQLPNKNIFFIGIGIGGHRALKHIQYMKEGNYAFQLQVEGVVICNTILDYVRKWNQYTREIRIARNDLWEAKFVVFMLETYLQGTPQTNPQRYYDFSPYSYFGSDNSNIQFYKDYAVRAYVEPAIEYWYVNRLKTMYENNTPDMIGFLAELDLAGNKKTDLVVLQPEDNPSERKNPDTTWDSIDKQ